MSSNSLNFKGLQNGIVQVNYDYVPQEMPSEIKLYPNPAQNNLMVTNEGTTKIKSIALYNNIGMQIPLENNIQKENQIALNLNNFADGYYLIQIVLEDNTIEYKSFIKSTK
jgi:hypothetical protein